MKIDTDEFFILKMKDEEEITDLMLCLEDALTFREAMYKSQAAPWDDEPEEMEETKSHFHNQIKSVKYWLKRVRRERNR